MIQMHQSSVIAAVWFTKGRFLILTCRRVHVLLGILIVINSAVYWISRHFIITLIYYL